ncbi:MAG: hypothetical protein CENE_00012 [Candidatus Celerinatantimonas neptuna]|nr:MAG: hypothetical protein CENE_00012 [Candidatus Celerinatantimonas neptuna]
MSLPRTIDEDLIKPEEVCRMLDIHRKTLWVWTNTHRYRKLLAPIRLTHRKVFYRRTHILAFIEKCQAH